MELAQAELYSTARLEFHPVVLVASHVEVLNQAFNFRVADVSTYLQDVKLAIEV